MRRVFVTGFVTAVFGTMLASCSSGPTPPDWQLQAKPALDAALTQPAQEHCLGGAARVDEPLATFS